LSLLDGWAHPALIALEGCFNDLLVRSCRFLVSEVALQQIELGFDVASVN
jgi:hypothetical protein